MRLLAAISTLVALCASALMANSLWQELNLPPVAVSLPFSDRPDIGNSAVGASAAPRIWPALFGEPLTSAAPAPQLAEPVAVPPVAEAPPAPPKPSLAALGYVVNGVAKSETDVWALVSHPGGPRVVRSGDALEPGITIARIGNKGLWISRGDDEPEFLGLAK